MNLNIILPSKQRVNSFYAHGAWHQNIMKYVAIPGDG